MIDDDSLSAASLPDGLIDSRADGLIDGLMVDYCWIDYRIDAWPVAGSRRVMTCPMQEEREEEIIFFSRAYYAYAAVSFPFRCRTGSSSDERRYSTLP